MDDRLLLSNLRGLVLRIDQAGRIQDARGAIDGIAGYSAEELVGMSAADLISPDDYEQVLEAFGQEGGAPVYDRPLPFPITLVSRTGVREPCDVLPVGFVDEDGAGWISTITPRRLYSAAYDIIDSVLDGAPLAEIAALVAARDAESYHSGERLQTTYVVSGVGSPDVRVHSLDGDQGFTDALIDEARERTSCLDSMVDDSTIQSVPASELPERLAEQARRCGYEVAHIGVVSDGGPAQACVFWMVSDARAMLVRRHAELSRKGFLRLLRYTLTRDRAEQVLREAATIDSLTGLGNRRRFEQEIAAADSSAATSVLYIDLDHFKAVNDDFGHDIGDRVLAEVGARLTAICRGDSVVARIGGDEFAVFLPGTSEAEASQVADRVQRSIAAPLLFDIGPAAITATVGMSASAGGAELRDLITSADLAMLASKRDRSITDADSATDAAPAAESAPARV
ncbi:MAG: sensor domain-containing diguanylate cyclase [Ilumatobacter sp.]|uniref:sensor domain-containing diguanylate cyclase n=1 Tax=Ilumatobacter sp. TaxID=1967498 RepID=UPI003C711670